MPKGNHVVYLKVKVPLGGRGQFFWVREGDKSPSEARQKAFVFNGDGAWHTYRIRPGWGGTHPIKQLRLDFQPRARTASRCGGTLPADSRRHTPISSSRARR